MRSFKLQISVVLLLSQLQLAAQYQYILHIHGADRDSASIINGIGIKNSFPTRLECVAYVNQLPALLQTKGYATASIDSLVYDSADAYIVLYIGDRYQWTSLDITNVDPAVLNAIGWRDRMFDDKPIDYTQVSEWQEKILAYMENNGHPFAKIYIDSLQVEGGSVSGKLKLEKVPLYK